MAVAIAIAVPVAVPVDASGLSQVQPDPVDGERLDAARLVLDGDRARHEADVLGGDDHLVEVPVALQLDGERDALGQIVAFALEQVDDDAPLAPLSARPQADRAERAIGEGERGAPSLFLDEQGPVGKGRVTPIKVAATFIAFENGQATIEKDTPMADGKSTMWEWFRERAQHRSPTPIKDWTRADMLAALKAWRGHGTEFWALEVEVPSKAAGRTAVTA